MLFLGTGRGDAGAIGPLAVALFGYWVRCVWSVIFDSCGEEIWGEVLPC